ncbi:MAG: hypothetical protein R3F39_12645 [Myxococcota bacterium]
MTGRAWVRAGWVALAALSACSVGSGGPGIGFEDVDAATPSLDAAVGAGCVTADDCAASDNPCVRALCTTDGQCVTEASNAGGACDDGNPCTADDACAAGVCKGGANACVCSGDADCAQFDDGNMCNGVLVCEDEGCVVAAGSVVSCAPAAGDGPCKQTVCEPTSGSCVAQLAAEDTPCDDGDLCTIGDRCVGGACAPGGVPLVCSGSGPCVSVTCEPAKGCVTEAAADGSACADDDPCTTGDACTGGVCVGSGSCTCVADEDCAGVDTNLCDGGLACDNGLCVHDGAPAVVCPPSTNACKVNVCAPSTGKCVLGAASDGTPCTGAAECAANASCAAGVCKPAPKACDDGDPCTVDSCDLVKGCVHSGATGPCDDGNACTSGDVCGPAGCAGKLSGCDCLKDADCPDDGNACNGVMRCDSAGACVVDPSSIPQCPGGSDCALAACDPATGVCQLSPAPAGTVCESADPCAEFGKCNGTTCAVTGPGCGPLEVTPTLLDFGLVSSGCGTKTLEFAALNTGDVPLVIVDAPKFVGCSAEFSWVDVPAPVTLVPGATKTWKVTYTPSGAGLDSCQIELSANLPAKYDAVVQLIAQGSAAAQTVDSFIQPQSQDVDVLFVIDNSGSMTEEQDLLASGFSDFIAGAASSQNNYHIGLVTTDIDDAGELQGTPRYVTPATVGAFAQNVKVGTNGSGTERGLESAKLALSAPNTTQTNTTCGTFSSCPSGLVCRDGFCGGANAGFLRTTAGLEVIFLSDEEDQSSGTTTSYLSFFQALKGGAAKGLFHAHALVGPPGGCTSVNGVADSGARYTSLVKSTNGVFASICSASFSTALKAIAAIAFGPGARFPLSEQPVVNSIAVKVDGVGCLAQSASGTNWSYSNADHSVTFDPAGKCLPAPGQTVVITYDADCFAP